MNFLWWCSGAHQEILAKYPSEHVKYSGLGGVLLATFALASISAGYALYSIFHSAAAAIIFGLLWGIIIFNFDRFLVSTMRKYGVSSSRQINMAIPRILLAVLIGFTIARPLELKIFEKEINTRVADNMHKRILLNDSLLQAEEKRFIAEATEKKNKLLTRKAAIEDTLFSLQASYISEADGTGGSGRKGIEKLTMLKLDAFNRSKNQYTPELATLGSAIGKQDSILSSIHSNIDLKRKEYQASLKENIGFLERNKALSDLSNEEDSVFWTSLLLTLLIILIETGPIISKLIMQTGPYDIALAREELIHMADAENEIRKNKALVFENRKKFFDNKIEVSDELLSQLSAVQRKKIRDAFDKWEKGEHTESNRQPLHDMLGRLKKDLEFSEENLL